MAKFDWDDNQKLAIGDKGLGIVVSAAAGSGKTAVLVERILRRICDEENPVSFDDFLVVTFTKAASKEMNQRLRSKLNERILENPSNRYLLKQKRTLPLANISSIDSFFYSLVKENFHRLDVTPDFRIVDPGEEKLLIKESFNETSDSFYAQKTPEFTELMDIIGDDKTDDNLFGIVNKLNEFADSHVSPEDWLNGVAESYNGRKPVSETQFGKIVLDHVLKTAKYAKSIIETALGIIEGYECYHKAHDRLTEDLAVTERITELAEKGAWNELKSYLSDFGFSDMRFGKLPKGAEDTSELNAVKTLRNKEKSCLNSLRSVIVATEEQFYEDMDKLYPVVRELIRFLFEFRKLYSEKKAERNVLDFSDVTHLAIKLLINPDGTYTDVAYEIRKKYSEILIDEYQDTNEAQDAIFKAISNDCTNLFLVGDVKQSVYGFRLATPYMFIEKIKDWDDREDGLAEHLILDCNYRSRKAILDCVNYVFQRTMSEEIGDIEYDDNESLKHGFKFPTPDVDNIEIDIVKKPNKSENISEPVFVARRIKELLKDGTVYDKDLKQMRPMRLGDITVLCRSNTHCKRFAATLNEEGVSAYFNEKTGFFDRLEIKVIISLLQILDNPLQDIPLLTVLSSPIFGFSPDELARIRINKRSGRLYYAVREATDEKSRNFIKRYQEFRSLSGVLSVSALIRELYEQTGYYTVAGALTNGEFRQMNLMLLLDYAASYEQNSNLGLSGFVRYLERCRDSKAQFDTASTVTEGADVVQVMTIHKSKGLEFPVVFLSGTNNTYTPAEPTLAVDEDVGAGLIICDKKHFKKYSTVQHVAAIRKRKKREYSEEIRLLYVAMTRAMEKLIITAEFQNPANRLEADCYIGLLDGFDPVDILGTNANIDVILKALIKHPDCGVLRDAAGFEIKPDSKSDFKINFNIIDELYDEAEETVSDKPTVAPDPKTVELIRQRAEYVYPYESLAKLVTKKSASSFNDDTTGIDEYFANDVPQFARDGAMTGAQRGTAMHRFMEVCDFEKAKADAKAERDRLVAEKLLTPEQGEVLNVRALSKFFDSEVYSRIAKSPRVMREQKFTVFVPASFVNPELGEAAKDEKVLVQGVIDCAFFEDGKIVVLDYKTDRVSEAGQLAELYHRQLEVYKTAAEECFGAEVSELLLYSFALGEQVKL